MGFFGTSPIGKNIQNTMNFDDVETLPNTLNNSIQAVYETNPQLSAIANVGVSLIATGTFYTTPNNSEFYLTQIYISPYTNSHPSANTASISAYINGVLTILLSCTITNNITPTTSPFYTINFIPPIKIDKATAITFSDGGLGITSAGIFGYTLDNTVYQNLQNG